MNLKTMHGLVESHFGVRTPYGEFFAALVRAISRVNVRGEKQTLMVTLSGDGDWLYTISEDTTLINEDTRIIGEGRWDGDIAWDSVNYALTLPRTYSKIVDVYYGDVRMECVPYDKLKEGIDSMQYANASNHLFFNFDINSDSTVIKARARLDYPIPLKTDEEYDGMLESAESMLITGIMSIMYQQPKHYNEQMVYLYRKQFEEEIDYFSMQVLSHDRQDHQQAQYTY